MAKPSVTLRSVKGSALTHTEADNNFANLRDATITVSDGSNSTAVDLNGTITFSGSGSVTVTESSGTVTISGTDTGIALTDLSVGAEGTASGDGSISYDNTTGVFTYTPPDLSNLGTLSNISEDTSPSLGGDLDILARKITSSTAELTLDAVNGIRLLETYDGAAPTGISALYAEAGKDLILIGDGGDFTSSGYLQALSNGSVYINSNGAGAVAINGVNYPSSGGSNGQFIKSDGSNFAPSSITEADITDLQNYTLLTNFSIQTISASGGGSISYDNTSGAFSFSPADLSNLGTLSNISEDTSPTLGGPLDTAGFEIQGSNGNITLNPQNNALVLDYTQWPGSDGSSGQVLTTDGLGQLSWNTPGTGLSDIVNDTTPQLGGDLDVNGNSIISASNGNINITPNGTGATVVSAINYTTEKLGANFSATGTLAPDVTDGNFQYWALSGNITINDMTGPATGSSITIVLDGTAGSYTGTFGAKLLFAGGSKTLTAGGVDVLTIVCVDDTTGSEVYLASLATDFS
jgi:hypothetical protein